MKTTFLKAFAALSLALSVHHYANAAPACLVNSLSITTGEYNATTLIYGTPPAHVAEPNWYIYSRSSVYTGTALLAGGHAEVVRPLYDHGTGAAVWSIMNPGRWISDGQANADPGIPVHSSSSITFERKFSTCGQGEVTINLDIINDNYISSVTIDGTPIPGATQPAVLNWNNYTAPTADLIPPPFTLTLPTGAHSLKITVENYQLTGAQANDNNPIGLNVTGSITSSSPIILNDQSPTACNGFTCTTDGGCNDLCYWKVQGNNILSGNNSFGTLTNDDVNIKTNSTSRGILTKTGLFGWNTTAPTAFLDVNCAGHNNGGGLSDIRFENLEFGTGKILAIDPATGYVFNSDMDVNSFSGWGLNGNSIATANFLGTTNNDDIRFKTFGTQRAVIKGSPNSNTQDPMAGFMGLNTASPTARLHVNCSNGNAQGSGASDIRFENLETGTGTLLAIDANGYVYNSGQTIPPVTTGTFWDYTGNFLSSTGVLGTMTPQDIQITTTGIARGIITRGTAPNDNGRLGWHTISPTAAFHVNCAAGNPDDGMLGSDVRFENLEPGSGNMLVIDNNGYIYNSGIPASQAQGMMQRQIDDLKAEVASLKANAASANIKSDAFASQNTLYQNTPNPFDHQTTIEFNLVKMEQSAYVIIYDLNGRELMKYPVNSLGKGKVVVDGAQLQPGMYLYSLVVDGMENDTKRMVLSK